jgi:hypothetical protein
MFGSFFSSKQKPWTEGQPLIDQIRKWDGKQPLKLREPVPDANPREQVGTSHLPDRSDEARLVTDFLELVRLLMMRGNEQARGALYEAAVYQPITSLMEMILHELHRQSWWQAVKLRPHARWFVLESRHTEPLRFGIALLGLSGSEQDLSLLQDVARHDEFTIAAANAVSALVKDPVEQWWQMAKNVNGWGKVHLVKRLARRCGARSDVQDWLLRQGWRDCVSPEYVAYSCANAGRLEQALSAEFVDEEMMQGAATLIGAMLIAGPAEHLEDYEGGVASISRWLLHLQGCPLDLDTRSMESVQRVAHWVKADEPLQVWERRAEQLGWTEEVRRDIAERCLGLLNKT